ncbi:MAG: 16S rRNA (guanine(966)-N(2))-methyltransferase, partial [uncultured Acetobacteraceae bacterium]
CRASLPAGTAAAGSSRRPAPKPARRRAACAKPCST